MDLPMFLSMTQLPDTASLSKICWLLSYWRKTEPAIFAAHGRPIFATTPATHCESFYEFVNPANSTNSLYISPFF